MITNIKTISAYIKRTDLIYRPSKNINLISYSYEPIILMAILSDMQAVMAQNNVTSSFVLGNLKNRNLVGEELPTQYPPGIFGHQSHVTVRVSEVFLQKNIIRFTIFDLNPACKMLLGPVFNFL
jgi:hypothetical protein